MTQLAKRQIWHDEDCACGICTAPHATPTPVPADREDPSFFPLCALAGVAAGNVIAFTLHPHGAWAALTAAIGAMLGSGR